MIFNVRDGKFDVVILAGPRIENWPSVGVRAISRICTEMGLTVGQFGGEDIRVRGVLPLPTGGLALIEDIQNRIHRIQARSIIRVAVENTFPDPFPGWLLPGLIPLSTAQVLLKENEIHWDPCTVILGSGNRALRFGSSLLERGNSSVICVEPYAQWGAKRFAGWEIERRRFEILGGRLIEGKPIHLQSKAPLVWQLRIQDAQGVLVIDVARVVSAGPFRFVQEVREYPPGSFLFELDQTAPATEELDVEGWSIEKERGTWLGCRISRALVSDLGSKRERLDRLYQKARNRLKQSKRHHNFPFTPSYQGKWMSSADSNKIRTFPGTPQEEHKKRLIASVECFEEISCNLCQKVCPTAAIQIGKIPGSRNPILTENACTACGLCVAACPSAGIPMIYDPDQQSNATLVLPWRGTKQWKPGEFATLLNRKGDSLGSGRITALINPTNTEQTTVQLLKIDVPTHLLAETRGIKPTRPSTTSDLAFLAAMDQSALIENKVEITLNGEKRRVRDRIPVSMALFETGYQRADDILLCPDGSCGLCQVTVDGVKKLACQTKIHRSMALRISKPFSNPESSTSETGRSLISPPSSPPLEETVLCPCLNITSAQVIARLKQGKLRSPEAILSVTHVGEGKCHGQICMGAFRRVLSDQGLDLSEWVDWRFPWSDWILSHN